VAYEVKLEVFEGPLDLLLHLITRQRVDIYEVSLAAITEEYLAAVRAMPRVDLESATGFLVVAATLLELKSARLLPGRAGEEGDERLLEERDLLLGRLVECATYRDAGAHLGAALAAGERFFARSVALEPDLAAAAPDPLATLALEDVARAAARALAPKPRPELDVSHVAPIRASIRDAIVALSGALRARGHARFDELCGARPGRIEVVVRFLALLELFKAGAVDVSQSERFGGIVARWTGEASLEDVLEDAEEYAVEEGR
jgi:segregation and condensation protein A